MEFNIEKIKKELNIELDDSIEEKFEDKFYEIINSEIELAKLFVNCFDVININLEKLDEEFKKWFNEYLEVYKEIRHELIQYDNGIGFGDWAIESRIRSIIVINRYSLIKFLEVFKNIFIE